MSSIKKKGFKKPSNKTTQFKEKKSGNVKKNLIRDFSNYSKSRRNSLDETMVKEDLEKRIKKAHDNDLKMIRKFNIDKDKKRKIQRRVTTELVKNFDNSD